MPAAPPKLRKQISLFLSNEDWLLLRREAARQRIPITEVAPRGMRPHLAHLAKRNNADAD